MLTAKVSKKADKWTRELKKVAVDSDLTILVGIFEDSKAEDGIQVAEYAFYNEFGTDRGIPERPFMRNTVTREQGSWAAKFRGMIKSAFKIPQAAELLGDVAAKDMMLTIEAGLFKSLKEGTIASKRRRGKKYKPTKDDIAKGRPTSNIPEHPLIDTGTMEEAITFRVEKGRQTE